jgi:hypothetical protein
VASKALQELVGSKRLKVGTKLTFKRREGSTTATVTEEGLRVGRKIYGSPSSAASAITGGPINGWAAWRLPNGELLDSLREGI